METHTFCRVGRITRNSVEIVRFHKISTSGNWVKLRYFMEWLLKSFCLIGCSIEISFTYEMLCAICYHLHNLINLKNTPGGVLILVNLQAEACNLTKTNTPPWVFFTFFKLSKWNQISRSITYIYMSVRNAVTQICSLKLEQFHEFP